MKCDICKSRDKDCLTYINGEMVCDDCKPSKHNLLRDLHEALDLLRMAKEDLSFDAKDDYWQRVDNLLKRHGNDAKGD